MKKKDKLKSSVTDLLYKIENLNTGKCPAPSMSDFGEAFKHALETGDTKPLNYVYKNIPRQEMVFFVSPKAHELLTEALDNLYKKSKNEQENQKAKSKNRHTKK